MSKNTLNPCFLSYDDIDEIAETFSKNVAYNPESDASLREVVQHLGGKIQESDLDGDTSGSINILRGSDFTITLHEKDTERRKNFTIGHELGHYVLHSLLGENPGIMFRHGFGRVETEANVFSAGFLMPKTLFLEKAAEFHGNTLDLALYFNVSIEVATVRKAIIDKEN